MTGVQTCALPISSKKSIVTDLDEAAKSASEGNLTDTGSDSMMQTDVDNQQTVDEALAVIRTLHSRAAILDKQLNNSGMDIDQYTHESFSTSQDILKVISLLTPITKLAIVFDDT